MSEPPATNRLSRSLVVIGGIALLAAMAVDTLAVIGRHAGMPVLGSIELVQAMVLVAGAVAMLLATLADHHALVRLLSDRAGPCGRALMHRLSALFSALFFLALLAGSVLIAADLWAGFEHSELLRVPYRPLRVTTIIVVLVMALVYLRRCISGGKA
jgi:TRAP-type C4-dicarboxylate transport system permease small subunit